jgi:signal transduction histidine kinase
MSVPASHDQQPPQQDALRSADLSELLGHVHTCWDNERRSLSRQLHDSLGSSLTALTMHLGLLMQKLPPDPALQDRAGHMKKLLGQIVETNRQMQLKLWNDKLEFLGVRVALDELVTQFGEQRGTRALQPAGRRTGLPAQPRHRAAAYAGRSAAQYHRARAGHRGRRHRRRQRRRSHADGER